MFSGVTTIQDIEKQRQEKHREKSVMRILVMNNAWNMSSCVDQFRDRMAQFEIKIVREDYIPLSSGIIRLITLATNDGTDRLTVRSQAKRLFGRSFSEQFLYTE